MERYLAAFECVYEADGKRYQFMCLPLRLENDAFALVINCLGSHLPPQLMHSDPILGKYSFREGEAVPEIFRQATGAINAAIGDQVLIQIKTGQVRED